ncbi:MAG: UMP kinase, partial [Candidatus Lokiarchaeota archaeon]|nr:UMP kinase [Candidatus Lokiarchaeota archaeon]
VKIGGSLIFTEKGDINVDTISQYAQVLSTLKDDGLSLCVVVGGGKVARDYIKVLQKFNVPEAQSDMMGIRISRINASLLIAALGKIAYPCPPREIPELAKALTTDKIIVMGGLQPGQSTNAVAAVIAEYTRSMLINATSVDGVYTEDPKTDPTAIKIDELDYDEFQELIIKKGSRAGEYALFDLVALKIVSRSSILTKIINGSDPNNILRAAKGENIGTTIHRH